MRCTNDKAHGHLNLRKHELQVNDVKSNFSANNIPIKNKITANPDRLSELFISNNVVIYSYCHDVTC